MSLRPPVLSAAVVPFLIFLTSHSSAEDSSELRTWKDATGKYSIQASLVDYDDGQAYFKKPDGKIVTVPVDRLSSDHKKDVLRWVGKRKRDVARLIGSLKDKQGAELQAQKVQVVDQGGKELARQLTREAIFGKNKAFRDVCLNFLVELEQDKIDVQTISLALKNKNTEIRGRAVFLICKSSFKHTEQGMELLTELLETGSRWERNLAAQTILQQEPQNQDAILQLVTADKISDELNERIDEAIAQIDSPTFLFTVVLNSPKDEVIRDLVKRLAAMKAENLVPQLSSLLFRKQARSGGVTLAREILKLERANQEAIIYLIVNLGIQDALGKQVLEQLEKIEEPSFNTQLSELHKSARNEKLRDNIAEALVFRNAADMDLMLEMTKKSMTSWVSDKLIQALKKAEDARIIATMEELLIDWNRGTLAAKVLTGKGWTPSSDADRVHLWIAQRDTKTLRKQWSLVRIALMKDLNEGNGAIVKTAAYAMVRLGYNNTVDEMLRIMKRRDSEVIARAFLNCGEKRLESAAVAWLREHGYTVISLPTVSGGKPWNSW